MADYDYEDKFVEELAKITSDSLKHKLVAIKNIIVKRLALEREFKGLHHKLESKYEALYRPIYDKRAKVIQGASEVSVDEIKEQLSKLSLSTTAPSSSEKGVPDFWLKALRNSSQFGPVISKRDEKVLSHLQDILCDFKEDGSFTLDFIFSQNEFFDHSTLTRNFILDKEKQSISKIESTKIDWKSEDLNPTIEKKKKKIKSKKKGGETKTVTKVEEVPSFFGFFKNYDANNIDKPEEDDEDEEDEGEIIEEEYDLGLFIKEELIPYAIEYYLGIIKEEGDDFEGEEFEDEEDEEEEEPVPKGKGKKK